MRKSKLKDVECRLMEERDLTQVAAIHKDAFYSSGAMAELRPRVGKRAMVAVTGDQVVGYILFDIETDSGEKVMYVANVGVREKSRSRGVCGQMLPWLMGRIGRYRCGSAYLLVSEGNDSARRCYERNGFVSEKGAGMNRMVYHPKPKSRSRKPKKVA